MCEVSGRNPDQIKNWWYYSLALHSFNKKGITMEIYEKICETILLKLRDLYPHMLMNDGYIALREIYEEDILDGHLIYLYETGQITLPKLEYSYKSPLNPKRGDGGWQMDVYKTRITASGLDNLRNAGK